MNKAQGQMHDRMPELYRGLYRRGVGKRSRAAAIRSKCLDCCCWQQAEVKNCLNAGCALYPYRMGGKPEIEAIEPLGALNRAG